jgi:hypothetical protein
MKQKTQQQAFDKCYSSKEDKAFLAQFHKHGITTHEEMVAWLDGMKARGFPMICTGYQRGTRQRRGYFYFQIMLIRRCGRDSEIGGFTVRWKALRIYALDDIDTPEKLAAIINKTEAEMGQPLSVWDGVSFRETPNQWDAMDWSEAV